MRLLPAAAAIRRARKQSQWPAEGTAAILALVFSAIYLQTRTAYYSVDAVRIASDIAGFHRTHDLTLLFHPGHLGFGPLVMTAWKAAVLTGYRGGPLPVMEAVNSIAGGIGVGLLSLVLRAIVTRSRAITILIPIAIGFSFGYWMAATDARAEMPSICGGILAILLLVRAMLSPVPSRAAWAGLATALSAALHIFAVLIVPIGLLGLWLGAYTQGSAVEENRARRINSAVYLAAAIGPLVLAYVVAEGAFLQMLPATAWRTWVTPGIAREWWWSPHFWANLRLDAYALRRSLFAEPGAKSGTFHLEDTETGMARSLLYWISLAAWFAAVYAILSATAFLARTHYRPFLTVAVTAAVLYAILFTCLNPGYFVYWVPVTIASAVITAIAAAYYRGRRRGALWLTGIGLWTAIFALSNYEQFIGVHRNLAANPWMRQAQYIETRTHPGDVFVVSGMGDDGWIVAYLPYFSHRTVFSLRDSLDRHNNDILVTARDLQGTVAQALSTGHKVYARWNIWDSSVRAALLESYHISNSQQIFVGLQRAPAWRDPENPDKPDWKLIPAGPAVAPIRHP